MDNKVTKGVPKSLFVIILTLLAAMYYYAAYIDYLNPEDTVENFYTSYFNRDFDTVAENLSVFWSINFLPQYSSMEPAELIAKRDIIESETSKLIAEIEKDNELPENISIDVLQEYTKTGENSALVVYNFKENGKKAGMEAAILIKEQGRLRILNMTPISDENLKEIQNYDISLLDENFKNLIKN